jgi:hypothetical protein
MAAKWSIPGRKMEYSILRSKYIVASYDAALEP